MWGWIWGGRGDECVELNRDGSFTGGINMPLFVGPLVYLHRFLR